MKKLTIQRIVILFICAGCGASVLADLEFGPKELVLAGANPIWVPGYSVPSYVDWNNDGRKDLAVGAMDGKLHIYLNQGTDAAPDLAAAIFAQNNGLDLIDYNGRLSPAIVDMNGDGYLDVLVGSQDGNVHLYQGIPDPATILLVGFGVLMLRRKL